MPQSARLLSSRSAPSRLPLLTPLYSPPWFAAAVIKAFAGVLRALVDACHRCSRSARIWRSLRASRDAPLIASSVDAAWLHEGCAGLCGRPYGSMLSTGGSSAATVPLALPSLAKRPGFVAALGPRRRLLGDNRASTGGIRAVSAHRPAAEGSRCPAASSGMRGAAEGSRTPAASGAVSELSAWA